MRFQRHGIGNARWGLNLFESHWGRDMRELALYLHTRRVATSRLL